MSLLYVLPVLLIKDYDEVLTFPAISEIIGICTLTVELMQATANTITRRLNHVLSVWLHQVSIIDYDMLVIIVLM